MEFTVELRPYDSADVTAMVEQVQAEYVEIYGGPDVAQVDAAEFWPPNGAFLVGYLDGVPVAMGGWRRRDSADLAAGAATAAATTAEIKRMYVARSARRKGLARRLLSALERTAADAGVRLLILNTGPEQPEAVALYGAAGYRPAAAFGHYAAEPGAIFLQKCLAR